MKAYHNQILKASNKNVLKAIRYKRDFVNKNKDFSLEIQKTVGRLQRT